MTNSNLPPEKLYNPRTETEKEQWFLNSISQKKREKKMLPSFYIKACMHTETLCIDQTLFSLILSSFKIKYFNLKPKLAYAVLLK